MVALDYKKKAGNNMQCIRPLKQGYSREKAKSGFGYSTTFSKKEFNPEIAGWSIPCRKCLPCRLNIGREKAIRAYHESKMHENNIFLTLTYSEDHLESSTLIYKHWQDFIKRLREHNTRNIYSKEERERLYIPLMVTGEYGEKNKRPHWHALLFNYEPKDKKPKYKTELGEQVYDSEHLTELWGKGNIEFGSVTLDSASYVARYAAKKLVHGNDQDHAYHPLHRTSSKRAIGRTWIERYFKHTFENGFVVLPNGQISKIPRYYVDWCKQHQPDLYLYYVTKVQPRMQQLAEQKARKEELENFTNMVNCQTVPLKRSKVEETILQSKFKLLQEKLKL